jgi:hypothetical protein
MEEDSTKAVWNYKTRRHHTVWSRLHGFGTDPKFTSAFLLKMINELRFIQ